MSCIWRFMYLDVIQPGDTFTMMMRKLAMALGAIAGSLLMLSLLYLSSLHLDGGHNDRSMDIREMDPHGTHLADCVFD